MQTPKVLALRWFDMLSQAELNSLPAMHQGIQWTGVLSQDSPRPKFAKGQRGRVNNVGEKIEEMETRDGDK